MNILFNLIIIISLIAESYLLNCYNCNDQNCFEIKTSTENTLCQEEANKIPTCYSFRGLFEDKVQAFRGCYNAGNEEDVCATLKSRYPSEFAKCDFCKEDNCNNKIIYEKDTTGVFCYTCTPEDQSGACAKPQEYKLNSVECPYKQNTVPTCYSYYVEGNETGVYRGCYPLSQDIQNLCDYLTEDHNKNNVTVSRCDTCAETNCNNKTIDSTKDDDTNNSVGSLYYWKCPLIFIICVLSAFL